MTTKVANGLDLQNQRIQNLGDGSSATDAVTKQQLDAVLRGLSWKEEVIAASTGNVTISGPGTTLDGVTLTSGDRVLLKDQTTASENGIYIFHGSGSALTRALDADAGTELSGATTTVQQGTVNADRVYRVTADDPITVGTTSITLAQVGAGAASYVGGNGLTLTGTTFDVGAGTGITVAADSVAVDFSVAVKKYAANVGNGSSTSIAVNHNLGTRDVTVEVFTNASPWDKIIVDTEHTDANNVTLNFATAPASNAYRCVVHG